MQSLLSQLNTVPGVVGSMLSDSEGAVLAQAFPPLFEPSILHAAASALADCTLGLEPVTGPIGVIDLRYADARIVVKPITRAHLLFLCAKSMNVQLLAISTSVAVPRLEKLVAGHRASLPAAAVPAVAPAVAPAAAVGQLYQTLQKIDAAIGRRKLDRFKARGQIAIKAGFAIGIIDPDSPDDPAMLSRLKAAASAVLGEEI